jgi:hypothetical protein
VDCANENLHDPQRNWRGSNPASSVGLITAKYRERSKSCGRNRLWWRTTQASARASNDRLA